MVNNSYWLWYPGDLELYHAMKQNFSRVERGCNWPAFWKSDGFRNRVVFRRKYNLKESTEFTVIGVSGSVGYVQAGDKKYPFGKSICCAVGEMSLSVHVACIGCVPSVYISGDVICSDDGWTVEDYAAEPLPAAYNRYFTKADRDPSEWPMCEKLFLPLRAEAVNGGALYEFETELTASLEVRGDGCPKVYLGESRAEALSGENCYYYCFPDPVTGRCPRQALRFAFIENCSPSDYCVRAFHQYTDIPIRACFECDDRELNEIFRVSVHTFMLCCGAFFIDGAKRDKWIWCGDTYQSMLINRYLTADADIEKRTLTALRGNDPVTAHVNTILDYSMLWILAVDEYYKTYGDDGFLRMIFPKAESLMEFIMEQRNGLGFVVGRKQDWVFIDWADFDRDGPLAAEQMLLAACLRVMIKYSSDGKREGYSKALEELLCNIEKYFWDGEKKAYIDSYVSGRRNVTRHASIFAILFDIADCDRKQILAHSVLLNKDIPEIKTPYFRFYELDALCRLGFLDRVMEVIKSYWGGMLKLGAVTFWEEFDPEKNANEQYEMYGDPFGKSMCHAWAAGPIYLLAKYYTGVEGDTVDGINQKRFFSRLDCSFPIRGHQISISYDSDSEIKRNVENLN